MLEMCKMFEMFGMVEMLCSKGFVLNINDNFLFGILTVSMKLQC